VVGGGAPFAVLGRAADAAHFDDVVRAGHEAFERHGSGVGGHAAAPAVVRGVPVGPGGELDGFPA